MLRICIHNPLAPKHWHSVQYLLSTLERVYPKESEQIKVKDLKVLAKRMIQSDPSMKPRVGPSHTITQNFQSELSTCYYKQGRQPRVISHMKKTSTKKDKTKFNGKIKQLKRNTLDREMKYVFKSIINIFRGIREGTASMQYEQTGNVIIRKWKSTNSNYYNKNENRDMERER